jgi:hypothetical protein
MEPFLLARPLNGFLVAFIQPWRREKPPPRCYLEPIYFGMTLANVPCPKRSNGPPSTDSSSVTVKE